MPAFLSNYRARQTVLIISRQTMRQILEQVKMYKEPCYKDEMKISVELSGWVVPAGPANAGYLGTRPTPTCPLGCQMLPGKVEPTTSPEPSIPELGARV